MSSHILWVRQSLVTLTQKIPARVINPDLSIYFHDFFSYLSSRGFIYTFAIQFPSDFLTSVLLNHLLFLFSSSSARSTTRGQHRHSNSIMESAKKNRHLTGPSASAVHLTGPHLSLSWPRQAA